MKLLAIVPACFLLLSVCVSYEIKLDVLSGMKLWVFNGNYFYAPTIEDIDGFLPTLTPINSRLSSARGKSWESDPGIWFTKHISGKKNVLQVSTKLTHALFVQGWIKFLADSNVAVVVKAGSSNRYLGSFYSDGKSWCDAVFNVGLESSIFVEVRTPEQNDYVLIDWIIMGVTANISQLQQKRTLNPCLLTPPSAGDADELEENKRTGRLQLGENELEGSESGVRPNLSTSTTAPEGADATLEELRKFLEQEEPRPESSTSTASTSSFLVDGRGRTTSESDFHSLPQLPTTTELRRNGGNSGDVDANVNCNCSCSCVKRST